MQCISDTIIG